MNKLLSAAAVAATVLIGSISGAMAACTGPAVMHDFPGTAFNMSLVTAQDGNCASNVGLNTSTAGAMVAGVAVDGWNVTEGTKADAAWTSGSGSIVSILKNIANGVAGAFPVTVNGTVTGMTGLTPGAAQTGTIVAGNFDLTSVGGTAIGAMANFGTNPTAVKAIGVNASIFLGTTAPSVNSGVKDAGTLRTVTATDQVAIAAAGQGATGTAVPSGAVSVGGDAQSSEPTKATTGNLTPAFLDLTGKVITSPFANRENFLDCAVTITGTSATTVTGCGAQGASVKIYITDLCVTRNDAGTTAVTATLNNTNTSVVDVPNNGGGGGFCKTYNVPIVVAANTAFQVTMGSSLTSVHVSASGYKGY